MRRAKSLISIHLAANPGLNYDLIELFKIESHGKYPEPKGKDKEFLMNIKQLSPREEQVLSGLKLR